MGLVSTKRMILPVVDETFQEHFDDNTWASPQEQVVAGYPIFIQPSNSTAKFVYKHDLGVLLTDPVLLTVTCPMDAIDGTVSVASTISISDDDMTYTNHSGVFQLFAGDFRYIKVTLDFTTANNHYLVKAGPVRLRISLKHKRDAGSGTSDDMAPATVPFNKDFIDVRSITVTPAFNALYPVIAVYDFVDVPNPTSFDVYCFRSDTGVQVENDFSWAAEGV